MSVHEMEIQNPWWTEIYQGNKLIEGRKGTEKWSRIQVGDIIRCIEPTTQQYFDTDVIAIRRYVGEDPLFSYLTQEGVYRALPGIQTITEAIAVYLQWSTPAEIRKHGMLAIEVRVRD
jgi:ASC-1-like (ASCH) protein